MHEIHWAAASGLVPVLTMVISAKVAAADLLATIGADLTKLDRETITLPEDEEVVHG